MPQPQALALLRALLTGRMDVDPADAERLVAACARLPLAVRIAAEVAATRPEVPLAALVDDLADESRRLEILGAGQDPRTSVETVFSWSYRQLDDAAAQAFRLLGVHPFGDLDEALVAALLGVSARAAVRTMGVLLQAHLVERRRAGSVGMHDLLHAYTHRMAPAARIRRCTVQRATR